MSSSEIERRPARRLILKELEDDPCLYQVRSIGAIRRAGGNQKVDVYLQRNDSSHTVIKTQSRVGLIPKLKPGSTWQNGGLVEESDTSGSIERLTLRRVQGPGSFVRASAHNQFFYEMFYLPRDVYWHGWLIETRAECWLRGEVRPCTLIIPCPVAFVGFFAAGSALSQALLRFPRRPRKSRRPSVPERPLLQAMKWRRRFWFYGKDPLNPRTHWDPTERRARVCLSRHVPSTAFRHVTLWYLCRHARREAMAISLRLAADTHRSEGRSAHIQALLPFTGEGTLDISGIAAEGRIGSPLTVLALQVHAFDADSLPNPDHVGWDRENDRRPSKKKAKGPLEDSDPGPRQFTAPACGGTVSSEDEARGNQFPVPWKTPSASFFSNVVFEQIDKAPPKKKAAPRPIPANGAPQGFAIGEGSSASGALPPVEVTPETENKPSDNKEEPPPPDQDTKMVEAFPADQPGFNYIIHALQLLRAGGYEVSWLEETGDWIYERDARGGGTKVVRVFAARILSTQGVVVLFEFEHRGDGTQRENGASEEGSQLHSRTATILARPGDKNCHFSSLARLVTQGWRNVVELGKLCRNELKGESWEFCSLRHPPRRGRSEEQRAATHASRLATILETPDEAFR